MKTFTFFWLNGKKEELKGENPADALKKAGYGMGALRALDFYSENNADEYKWDEKNYSWINERILKECLKNKL